MPIYIDNASTTKIIQEVIDEMALHISEYGNPSSVHTLGRKSRELVENSRRIVASHINAKSEEIIFTSGGTESNNLAILGFMSASDKKHVITSAIEHVSVYNAVECGGFPHTFIGVDSDGIVNLDELENSIIPETALVSIMHVNNETGSILPLKEISAICRKHGVLFHTDCVQSIGHLDIDVDELGIDMLSLSGHKIYAPKGIGALYVRSGVKINPLLYGGNQEHGLRAGTENILGIIGLGKAVELIPENRHNNLLILKNRLIDGIYNNISCAQINSPQKSIDSILNVSFCRIESQLLLDKLDKQGIYASRGSACGCDSKEPSHVLTAMGIDRNTANSAIRFSFGIYNIENDIDDLLDVLIPLVNNLRMKPEPG